MITGCCPVQVCKMVSSSTMEKFDPEEHKGSVYEAFNEFVDEFQYEQLQRIHLRNLSPMMPRKSGFSRRNVRCF